MGFCFFTRLFSTIKLCFSFFFSMVRSRKRQKKLLPSPPKLPIIGNLLQLSSLLHVSLDSLSKKYGPIFQIHIGSIPTVIISSSKLAEQVMRTHDLSFASRPKSSIVDRLVYGTSDIAFSPYGDYWKHAKRLSVQNLLSLNRVESLKKIREEEVALFLSAIRHASSSASPLNLSNLMATLTNDIICRAIFGRKYFSEKNKFADMLKEMGACLHSFPMRDFIPWLGWVDEFNGLNARVNRCFQIFDAFLEQALDSVEGTTDNFVAALLSSMKEDTVKLSRDNIKALVNDMLVAGTDTTSSTLEWAMAELISHPAIMRRAQDEIRERFAELHPVFLSEEEANHRVCYLKAIINETLRLHPPFPTLVHRKTMKHSELEGYDIPAGTTLLINAWTIARDENYWDAPHEFIPDRFLRNEFCHNKNIRENYHFLPFGAGRRGCPGANFSYAIIQYVMANLLCYFDWEIPEEYKEEVLDMSEFLDFNVHKKLPLTLVAKEYLHTPHILMGIQST